MFFLSEPNTQNWFDRPFSHFFCHISMLMHKFQPHIPHKCMCLFSVCSVLVCFGGPGQLRQHFSYREIPIFFIFQALNRSHALIEDALKYPENYSRKCKGFEIVEISKLFKTFKISKCYTLIEGLGL